MTLVRRAQSSDLEQIIPMREALAEESRPGEHREELMAVLEERWSHLPYAMFVAETEGERIAGFVEVGLRSHADGCDPSRSVGFVEAWYVAESHRRSGVGGALIAAAEEWARAQGCREMASDTLLENELGQRAHEALGFQLVDRCVNYRKDL